MKRILLLMGIVPILMSLASCGKKENVTVEETTEAWEELSYLGTYLQKQGYIHEVKSAISEFMQYGVSVKDLEKLMEYKL